MPLTRQMMTQEEGERRAGSGELLLYRPSRRHNVERAQLIHFHDLRGLDSQSFTRAYPHAVLLVLPTGRSKEHELTTELGVRIEPARAPVMDLPALDPEELGA